MHRVLDRQWGNQTPAGRCALAIMTKAPRAGTVKTRLQPPLTPSEAAELNTCFLRDIAAVISAAGERSQGVGVFTPARSEKEYEGIFPSHFDLIPQRGNGFGERLTNAADDLLHVGFESCCLINSDSPTATAEAFREAVAQLQDADDRIVLGPSDDGGYYLIGMRKLNRHLFEEIDWSTERVFAQTDERAREVGLKVHVLPKDRKSTRLNSSHRCISYAVFCLKKKNKANNHKSSLIQSVAHYPPLPDTSLAAPTHSA